MEKDLHPLRKYDGHMNTYSGKKFNLLKPKADQILIEDIAKGLAYKGYFSGQTPKFFSIAQHCLMVCDLMPEVYQKDKDIMMLALLHDASEAYTGDMIKPLKIMLPEFQKIENKIQDMIVKAFKLKTKHQILVKVYDQKAQEICFGAFYAGTQSMDYYSPEKALMMFMERYYQYLKL